MCSVCLSVFPTATLPLHTLPPVQAMHCIQQRDQANESPFNIVQYLQVSKLLLRVLKFLPELHSCFFVLVNKANLSCNRQTITISKSSSGHLLCFAPFFFSFLFAIFCGFSCLATGSVYHSLPIKLKFTNYVLFKRALCIFAPLPETVDAT